jgi:rubredoxin
MIMKYFYCPHCGYEDMDVDVAFSATYANGDFYHCPKCYTESSDFEIDEKEK